MNPQAGHEQAGWQPPLVVSPEGKVGYALVCPITSGLKWYLLRLHYPRRSQRFVS
ncbi:type II toxin-antitoxin system PemK/MazF family toxin [Neomoorella thermoacetica]|uniref:type II toxin-antitoxin system PemK/MazF family toxin n=1 Tax=Neomoorella thermoacetica TaxID=1525 RepID=UPI0030B883C6